MAKLDLRVGTTLLIPAHELDEQASRSGGPGGQHVNKTSSRVTLRWNLRKSRCLSEEQRFRLLDRLNARITRSGDLIVHVDGHRSRRRNLEEAQERLIEILAEALEVPRSRHPTRPSRSARRRRMDDKRHRSNLKRDRSFKDD